MSREYTLAMANSTLAEASGVSTLVFFQAMTAAPVCAIEVFRAWASQAANATSNQQQIRLVTQVSTFPTLTSQAPQKIKAGDPASLITGGTAGAAGTSGVNSSAEGGGAKTPLIPDAFNVLNGWLWVPTPAETHVETPQATAHGYGLSFPTYPVANTNWNGGIVLRELG
jgi:hypothetical protein